MIQSNYKYAGILPITPLNQFDEENKNESEFAVLLSERKSQAGYPCFSDLGQELTGNMVGRPWFGLKNGPWRMADPKEGDQPFGYKRKLITDQGQSVIYLKLFQDVAPFCDARFDGCHWVRFSDVKEAATTTSKVSCLCCKKIKSLPLSRRCLKALKENPDLVIQPQELKKMVVDTKAPKIAQKNYVTDKESTFVGDVHGCLNQIILPLVNKGVIEKTGKTIYIDAETTKRTKKTSESLHSKNIVEVPELKLNENYTGNPVIFLGDYIDHCSLEKGLKAFYLMADLLNQQKELQKKRPDYEALVSILGNHELHVFKNGKANWNLKGASSILKKKYAKALHQLIQDGKMQMSYAHGGILSTHSCVSRIFMEKLLEEVDKEDVKVQKSLKYFLDEKNHSLIDFKGKKIKKLNISNLDEYQSHLEIVSNYINTLSRDILAVDGKYDNGTALKKRSVLFTDPGPNGSITPLWTSPSQAAPLSSIQMAYGHCRPGDCGRTAKFKDGFIYKHIVCYDGGSYEKGKSPCYAECNENGEVTIVK